MFRPRDENTCHQDFGELKWDTGKMYCMPLIRQRVLVQLRDNSCSGVAAQRPAADEQRV